MENQITPETTSFQPTMQVENRGSVEIKIPKQNNFLIVLLSILLIFSVGIAGFFAFQTQKLVKELTLLKTESIPTYEPTAEPVATSDPTLNWKTYTDKNGNFSFKYPKDWFLWNSTDGDSLLLDESSFDPNLIAEPDQVDVTFTTTADKELIDAYKTNFVSTSQITTNNNVVFVISDKSLSPKEDGPTSQYLFAQTVVDGNLYRFGLTSEIYKPVFNQILSTFKFTN